LPISWSTRKRAKILRKNPLPKSRLQEKCGRKCVICEKGFRGELKTRSGRVIKINKKINCRTSNVVYAVHCTKCKHIVYVGETETMLKDRIQNHLSDIRTCKKYDKPDSIHFNSKGHSIDDFRFAGIEISRKNNTIYRQTRESLVIKMCNTQQEGIDKRK
jgi:hypothetical protein